MGKCLSKTASRESIHPLPPAENRSLQTTKQFSYDKRQIEANKKSQMQGVHELKMNYVIEDKQVVLGSGAFGKVFLSRSVHNK